MKKHNKGIKLFFFSLAFVLASFVLVTSSGAAGWQQVVIPYAYVGDGWDSVIVISNISTKTIKPLLLVRNGNTTACAPLANLEAGQIYVNTFSAVTGWCFGLTPPIPGIFQVYVGVTELSDSDLPFGVAIAINNASFGGFSFQQYKSEPASTPSIFIACACY